jgi:hypothetical protein
MFIKHEKNTSANEQKSNQVIPSEVFFQDEDREQEEHKQRDHFLYGFQLEGREALHKPIFIIGRNHETIFKKSDPPADENEFQDRCIGKIFFQMAIPRERHEAVGDQEQEDGAHILMRDLKVKRIGKYPNSPVENPSGFFKHEPGTRNI